MFETLIVGFGNTEASHYAVAFVTIANAGTSGVAPANRLRFDSDGLWDERAGGRR
jgi:hypothetical protein